MDRQKILHEIQLLSFTGGMNVRYRQKLASFWKIVDYAIKIFVGIISIISLILSLLTMPVPSEIQNINIFSISISIISLIAAVILNIVPTTSKASIHEHYITIWGQIREDADMIELDLDNSPDEKDLELIIRRVRELKSKKNRINAMETKPNKTQLDESYKEENKSRGWE